MMTRFIALMLTAFLLASAPSYAETINPDSTVDFTEEDYAKIGESMSSDNKSSGGVVIGASNPFSKYSPKLKPIGPGSMECATGNAIGSQPVCFNVTTEMTTNNLTNFAGMSGALASSGMSGLVQQGTSSLTGLTKSSGSKGVRGLEMYKDFVKVKKGWSANGASSGGLGSLLGGLGGSINLGGLTLTGSVGAGGVSGSASAGGTQLASGSSSGGIQTALGGSGSNPFASLGSGSSSGGSNPYGMTSGGSSSGSASQGGNPSSIATTEQQLKESGQLKPGG